MLRTIVPLLAHVLVWLRGGFALDRWAARQVTRDALARGAAVGYALRRGVAAGTDLMRRHRHG
jgi:hypothetical protein